jgi:hypothetical protein
MTTAIALGAIGLFGAGVLSGIIGLVSVAIRQEEKNFTLQSRETPGTVAQAGRWLNGVHFRI